MSLVTDSRSYSEIKTFTDHRMVIWTTKLNKFHPRTVKKNSEEKIDFQKLKQPEYQQKFHDKVQEKLRVSDIPDNIQERWDRVTHINKEAAWETLGHIGKVKLKSDSEIIHKLSEEQLKLK